MQEPSDGPLRPPERELLLVLDVALGMATAALDVLTAAGRGAYSLSGPVVQAVRRPPMLVRRLPPVRWVGGLARRGAVRREVLVVEAGDTLDDLVPVVAAAVVRRLDLAQLVHDYVDVDQIVRQVDLNDVATRLDIDAVAGRLDLDAVVARIDIDAIARRLDLDGLVATVDLDAAAARLDVDAVIERVDLIGLAREIVAGIDLPEIIRDSTGAVASDTLREVRMQSITGDDAVARVVDRILHPGRRSAPPPATPDGVPVTDSAVATPSLRPGRQARSG